MEHTFAFAGDGIAGCRKVKEKLAVFEGDGVRLIGEEGLEHLPQHFRGNGAHLHLAPSGKPSESPGLRAATGAHRSV
jgi:hypothetical protein